MHVNKAEDTGYRTQLIIQYRYLVFNLAEYLVKKYPVHHTIRKTDLVYVRIIVFPKTGKGANIKGIVSRD
jgi:hypothetical protein